MCCKVILCCKVALHVSQMFLQSKKAASKTVEKKTVSKNKNKNKNFFDKSFDKKVLLQKQFEEQQNK